jgi:hypothetical protein
MPVTLVDTDAFFGIRGSNDFNAASIKPSILQTLFRLKQGGDYPLVGMLAMLPKRTGERNPTFTWWERSDPTRHHAVTVYVDAGLTTPYVAQTATAGTVVYLLVATPDTDWVDRVRKQHTVLLFRENDPAQSVMGYVTGTPAKIAGVGGIIALELFTATVANQLGAATGVTHMFQVGNVNDEGSVFPQAVSYDARQRSQQTQIIRTAVRMTRSAALRQQWYDNNPLATAKADALVDHAGDIEYSMVFNRIDLTAPIPIANGEPMPKMDGLLHTIEGNAPQNVFDFYNDAGAYAGKAWKTHGWDFLNTALLQLSTYMSGNTLCLCGNGFLKGLNDLAAYNTDINVQPAVTRFGLDVHEFVAPYGLRMYLKTSALFNQLPTYSNACLMLTMGNIRMVEKEATNFQLGVGPDKKDESGYDGTVGGWLTDCSVECRLPETHGIIYGGGLDNKTYVP